MSKPTFTTYNIVAFFAMIRAQLEIKLDQIGAVLISTDGRTLRICLRNAGATLAELGTYAVEVGWHAIAKIGRNPEISTLQIDGSPGLKNNPGLAAVVAWIDQMLTEAGQDDMFCGFPGSAAREICFVNVNNATPDGQLAFVTTEGLVQATALPDGGYVGRYSRKSGNVYYLAPASVQGGAFAIGNWAQIPVPGVNAVTHLPERIDDQARVCVNTETGGREGFEVLDLKEIGQSKITSKAAGAGIKGLRFLGTTGAASDFAVVDASPGTSGFKAGITVMPRSQLTRQLGRVGQAMAAAA